MCERESLTHTHSYHLTVINPPASTPTNSVVMPKYFHTTNIIIKSTKTTHRRSTRLLQKNSRTLGINTFLKQSWVIGSPSTNQCTPRLFGIRQITHRCTKNSPIFGGRVICPFFEFRSSWSGGTSPEEPWFDDVV